jgi:hypothetical protein
VHVYEHEHIHVISSKVRPQVSFASLPEGANGSLSANDLNLALAGQTVFVDGIPLSRGKNGHRSLAMGA